MALPLKEEITKFFPNHTATDLRNLLITTEAIFEAESTNLNKVKKKVGRVTGNLDTKPESNYKRLTRFFTIKEKRVLIRGLACLSFSLLNPNLKSASKYLTLDGTTWEIGDKKVHILTLCLVYNGVSIPLWWEELDKKGHSNLSERKKVIKEASKILHLKGLVLLADREYIGRDWFKFLKDNGIEFIIRLKANTYCEEINQASEQVTVKDTLQKARYSKLVRMAYFYRYSKKGVGKYFYINGQRYTFVIVKNPKEDLKEPLLYFISTLKNRATIIQAYPIRWTIECCFKHLKSNGFDLEAVNFKCPLKIMLMMAITSFLYILCITEGIKQLKTKKKSDWKKFKDGTVYLTVSFFAKGLDYLNNKFYNLKSFLSFLNCFFGRKNACF